MQRWNPCRRLPGTFRARVLFLRRPDPSTDAYGTLLPDIPLLDSPVLDDLTIVTEPAAGPRLLVWEAP
jgi:hypothetical protein